MEGVLRRERHDSSRRERTGNARLCFFLLLVSFLFSSIEKSPRRRILTLASSPVPSTKLGTTTLSLPLSIVIAFLQREVVSIPYGTHFLRLFPKPSSICYVPLSPNLQVSEDALPHASTKLKKTRFPGPYRGRSFDVQSAPSNYAPPRTKEGEEGKGFPSPRWLSHLPTSHSAPSLPPVEQVPPTPNPNLQKRLLPHTATVQSDIPETREHANVKKTKKNGQTGFSIKYQCVVFPSSQRPSIFS
ncbi:hypothetical protein CPAR01_00986 [Colletotrichum paranaense]|uniref:Uncharacterized protein n=1 Tax=Colletotrichum paranaense TaxID=1914294 RepID=A0ABQ9T5N7_9PEZI|nr:uncharacterized protein CPAR01_00986 [Colletotrichum paranaense]KAK1547019.1 hypothetical protein CPAR01_00986 [Colletotrichum paranaense]